MHQRLVLASASPRRRELLQSVGLECEVITADIDETRYQSEPAKQYVQRMAREKAQAVHSQITNSQCVVLAADTVVCWNDEVFGKPVDQYDAFSMWRKLSGNAHQVSTAVCLMVGERVESCCVNSDVFFTTLSEQQMLRYWQSGEPQDKAGGYAIQGLASAWVEKIEGSYSNVVGLPLFHVNQLLIKLGLNWL